MLQPVEYTVNGVLAVFLTISGKWISAAVQIVVCLWNLRMYLQRDHIVDVTEIFRQLPKQKMTRMIKLVIFLFAFVLIIYRYAERKHCWHMHVTCTGMRSISQMLCNKVHNFCHAQSNVCSVALRTVESLIVYALDESPAAAA